MYVSPQSLEIIHIAGCQFGNFASSTAQLPTPLTAADPRTTAEPSFFQTEKDKQ